MQEHSTRSILQDDGIPFKTSVGVDCAARLLRLADLAHELGNALVRRNVVPTRFIPVIAAIPSRVESFYPSW
jgi:hypothetical protein